MRGDGGHRDPPSLGDSIDTPDELAGRRFANAFPLLVLVAVAALALFVRLLSSHYGIDLSVLLAKVLM